jgi:HEAT repeat protein
VEALLARLGAPALAPLLSHSATMRAPEVRALLDDAITRLAAANTGELARLIESPAPEISVEAIRRAAALRSPAAVAPIAQVLATGTLDQRQAAVPALAAIATPGALQILERAIEDDERTLRSLAVEALATRQHRPAAPRIERAIREWVSRTGNNAEKALFFDALATLGGESAVPTLDGLLNKRDILRRGEEPSTRAAAALALGRIRSESAIASLGRSANDKDIVVRTAVARAMRAGER